MRYWIPKTEYGHTTMVDAEHLSSAAAVGDPLERRVRRIQHAPPPESTASLSRMNVAILYSVKALPSM